MELQSYYVECCSGRLGSPGVTTVVQRVMDQVCNGSLIVLHDGACGGQDVALTLQKLIPRLLQQGYHFVTVDTLCSNKKTCL